VKYLRTFGTMLLASLSIGAKAQLIVDQTLTPEQLVQNVLLGAGVTASNVTFNGISGETLNPQVGSFDGSASSIGLQSGLLMGTGDINVALGPNDEGAATLGGGFFDFGDPDLEVLSGVVTNDAAILEFDFIPTGDSIKFRYVFSSEEYDEYVCGTVNDAFGFFLSGPGIAGPFTLGAINLALVPGTQVPVSINTVNNGTVGANGISLNCSDIDPNWVANSIYFLSNANGTTVQYDGQTVVLTAFALVQCGVEYHIKLAIADGGDSGFDSGVFLEGGSFSSAPFIPQLTPGPGIVGTTMFESCFPMELSFIRLGDVAEADTFQVFYSGSFTNGEDIVPAFPAEVIFAADSTSFPITFNAPVDADVSETITITVISISGCTGDTIENVFEFNIEEAPPLVLVGPPFSVDCGDAVAISPTVSGGFGAYGYDWGGGQIGAPLLVSPLSDTSYPVTVTDSCGLSATTLIPVTVIPAPNPFSVTLEPGPTVQGNSAQESCFQVFLNFSRSGGTVFADTAFVTLSGTATPGVDFSDLPDQVIFPAGQATVQVPVIFGLDADGLETLIMTLGDVSICNGGFSTLTYSFTITQAPALVAQGSTATIPCGGSASLVPTVTGGYTPYSFAWNTGSLTATLVVGPIEATTYTVTVTDTCGTETLATFNVGLLPPPPIGMAILGPSTVTEACESTSINIIRPAGTQGALVVNMSYSGMATNSVDFNWPTTLEIGADLLNAVFPFEPLEDGVADNDEDAIITASYTDSCGRTVSASVTISIVDAPVINLETSNFTAECSEDSLPISVIASGGYGGLSLVWNTGDEGPLTYAQLQTGATYVVTATDACGRQAFAQSVVLIDCEIIVPNVFTPNGDGSNDRFDIDGILSTQNTVKIFNRWGQVVFEATNYRNNWSASGIPDGTYFYEVIVPREPKPLTGHVTILRN